MPLKVQFDPGKTSLNIAKIFGLGKSFFPPINILSSFSSSII
jgi:hypothetical protein